MCSVLTIFSPAKMRIFIEYYRQVQKQERYYTKSNKEMLRTTFIIDICFTLLTLSDIGGDVYVSPDVECLCDVLNNLFQTVSVIINL